jgi:hypothetical protein
MQLPVVHLLVTRSMCPPQYDGVLENVSQDTVYTCCGHEVVEGVLAGYSGTLMCYGQVGTPAGLCWTTGSMHRRRQGQVQQRAATCSQRPSDSTSSC